MRLAVVAVLLLSEEVQHGPVCWQVAELRDGAPDTVQHVVGVGLHHDLDPLVGQPGQEDPHSGLAGRMEVSLRIFHDQQATRLSDQPP
ncbi:hypothetical protein D3C72_1935900 [compost metagenome]